MNKKMRFLTLLLVGLCMAQPSPVSAISPLGAAQAFGGAWYRVLTCRALRSHPTDDEFIIKTSIGVAIIAIPIIIMVKTIRKAIKIGLDMKKGIQEQDHDLVSQTAPLMMKNNCTVNIGYALYNDNPKALQALLEHNADPNIPIITLWPFRSDLALCIALARNDFESAHLLLDYGANPTERNSQGVAPIHYCYKDEKLAQKMRTKMEDRAKKDMEAAEKLYRKQPPSSSRLLERLTNMKLRIHQRFSTAFRHKNEEAA